MSTSMNAASPEAVKAAIVRRSRIVPGRQSYRPGQSMPVFESRELELHLFFPASTSLGEESEWTAVRELAAELAQYADVGQLTGFGLQASEFKLVMQLRGAAAINEDYMLTQAFLRLKDLFDGSDVVQGGFSERKPHWKVIKGGDFVADEGAFSTSPPPPPLPTLSQTSSKFSGQGVPLTVPVSSPPSSTAATTRRKA